MTTPRKPSLSLGPIYYLWDGPKWRDFYFRIADEAPVTHVVADVVDRLEAAGKRVTLSSLAMVTLERESQHVRSLIAVIGWRQSIPQRHSPTASTTRKREPPGLQERATLTSVPETAAH